MKENNIVAFPSMERAKKVSIASDDAVSGASAQVHTLLTKPSFRVYEERFSKKRELFEPFFATLFSTGKVMIIERGKDILNAILRVVSKQAWEYEITMSDFLNMTEPVIGMTGESDAMWYITSNLDSLGIAMAYATSEEEHFVESFMDEEGLSVFRPEETKLVWNLWSGEHGFYGLYLKVTEAAELYYSPDEFLKPENIPLLHLLSHSREEYLCNGIDINGDFTLELSMYEYNDTLTTHIPLPYLDRIIDAAILRKYPIYANYSSSEKRMNKFYADIVFPLLNPEIIDEDE